LLAGCPGANAPPATTAPAAVDAAPADHGDDAAAAPPAAAPAAEQPAAEPPPVKPLEREAKFVDRHLFLQQHPNAAELEKNVINASDLFSATAQGYFAAASQLTLSALKHDLDLQYQLKGQRWPSFTEYQEILNTHGIKLKGLKPRQVYAYDDKTGQVSILEVAEGETID